MNTNNYKYNSSPLDFPPMPEGFTFSHPGREYNSNTAQRDAVEALFWIVVNRKLPTIGAFSPDAAFALQHNVPTP